MIKKKNNQSKVSDLLTEVLGSMGLREGYEEYRLSQAWPEVVGRMVASRTKSIHFADGVYYVSIDSPAIRSELSFMRSELVRRLNEVCGSEGKVKEIVFR
jgi:predicted nucleic acid-binding Zn ribbon protein